MHYATLSLAFMASVAVASKPALHFHPRRSAVPGNSTITSAIPQTTLTVDITSLRTTVSGDQNVTVTDTIERYTTVCPVTAAQAVSSAIQSLHSSPLASAVPSLTASSGQASGTGPQATGAANPATAASASAPFPTAASGEASTAVGSGAVGTVPVATVASATTEVLTYTIGTGTSAQAVTTTIVKTLTQTQYATVSLTATPAATTEQTTTLSTTLTSTQYFTVSLQSSATASGAEATGGVASAAVASAAVPSVAAGNVAAVNNGASSGCSAVTVTLPASTVTVYATVSGAPDVKAAATTASSSESAVVVLQTATVVPVQIPASSSSKTKTKTKCSSVFPSSATLAPSGFYGNGTAASIKPTGNSSFLTSIAPTGTGAPIKRSY